MTAKNNNEIIVFTGSTISSDDARKILPNANYHRPIKSGDIFRVLRLNPKIIVIIDGFFEQTGSVWHKEILFAISKGVRVYGASSMGALRAAELYQDGMIGSGKIFSYYQDKSVALDDDEVAITHLVGNITQKIDILPLINVRFTLQNAVRNEKIDNDQLDEIINKIKKIPYYKRSLKRIETQINDKKLFELIRDNYIDQKKLDAIELLDNLSKMKICEGSTEHSDFNFTFFTRKLYREIISSPFENLYDWLPEEEKIICESKGEEKFFHVNILSKILHIIFDIYNQENKDEKVDCEFLLSQAISTNSEVEIKSALKVCLAYFELYRDYKKLNSNWLNLRKMLYVISALMTTLRNYLKNKKSEIEWNHQNIFFESFRRNKRLLSSKEAKQWLKENGISLEAEYKEFIFFGSILHFIVIQNNAEYFGINTIMNMRPWLTEAFLISEKLDILPCLQNEYLFKID